MSNFDRAPQGSVGVKRGVDTQRVLSGKRLLARSERQALHKLRRSRLKRPGFMQEVSSRERSTFVQFTYSDFCHNFSNVATA